MVSETVEIFKRQMVSVSRFRGSALKGSEDRKQKPDVRRQMNLGKWYSPRLGWDRCRMRLPETAGHVQMKHRISLLIRKKCSGAGDFMYIVQNNLQGGYGHFIFLFRTGDEFAALSSPANDNQRRCLDGLDFGKLLDLLMNDIPIFKAKNKNSTGFAF